MEEFNRSNSIIIEDLQINKFKLDQNMKMCDWTLLNIILVN